MGTILFNEIYGCYYNAVAAILSEALEQTLTKDKMKKIIEEKAFSESFMTIIPALESEKWQLIDSDYNTPIKHKPVMPLTILQKRWLKAISLDPKIKLFGEDLQLPDDICPLFTPEDYIIFDKYNDGDPYEDENYINVFRTILEAIHNKKQIEVEYEGRKGNHRKFTCVPKALEYSEKDDKFRLLVSSCRFGNTLKVSGIQRCDIVGDAKTEEFCEKKHDKQYFVLELIDERNALERAMLHFAHFEKSAERISDKKYNIKIFYEGDDETELVIRVLSFGPLVKVTEPDSFINLIKDRLIKQKSCGLK